MPGVLADRLLDWFDARERDVPWRQETDAYRIWVAEVMAQQTRMETVGPYYRRFLERFPTVRALARAPIDDVLRVWQGLGYYARARHLHAAAGQIVERHDGRVPADVEALRQLSGVGPYTAGAVASIAFGIAEPAVDGNARRVLSRLFDIAEPTPARLDAAARALVAAGGDRPASINQAIMDLGGSVCTPTRPSCEACPWGGDCAARAAGTVDRRPPRGKRSARPTRTAAAAVLWRGGEVLFVRRPERGLLGGLWDLPGTAPRTGADRLDPAELLRALKRILGVEAELDGRDPIAEIRHTFSHFRLELAVWETRWVSGDPTGGGGAAWVAHPRFDELAVPTYLRSVLPSLGPGTE